MLFAFLGMMTGPFSVSVKLFISLHYLRFDLNLNFIPFNSNYSFITLETNFGVETKIPPGRKRPHFCSFWVLFTKTNFTDS